MINSQDDRVDHNEGITKEIDLSVGAMLDAREFPNNTCPSSRHVQMIAEALVNHGHCPMITEDPLHVAGSLATVVEGLYSARAFLGSLGYTWTVENGKSIWIETK